MSLDFCLINQHDWFEQERFYVLRDGSYILSVHPLGKGATYLTHNRYPVNITRSENFVERSPAYELWVELKEVQDSVFEI